MTRSAVQGDRRPRPPVSPLCETLAGCRCGPLARRVIRPRSVTRWSTMATDVPPTPCAASRRTGCGSAGTRPGTGCRSVRLVRGAPRRWATLRRPLHPGWSSLNELPPPFMGRAAWTPYKPVRHTERHASEHSPRLRREEPKAHQSEGNTGNDPPSEGMAGGPVRSIFGRRPPPLVVRVMHAPQPARSGEQPLSAQGPTGA